MPSQTYLALIQRWLSLQIKHCCIVIRKQELLSDFMERSRSHSRGWGTAQPSPGAERDWEQQLLAGGKSLQGRNLPSPASGVYSSVSHGRRQMESRRCLDNLDLKHEGLLQFGPVLICYRVFRIMLSQPWVGN